MEPLAGKQPPTVLSNAKIPTQLYPGLYYVCACARPMGTCLPIESFLNSLEASLLAMALGLSNASISPPPCRHTGSLFASSLLLLLRTSARTGVYVAYDPTRLLTGNARNKTSKPFVPLQLRIQPHYYDYDNEVIHVRGILLYIIIIVVVV